MCFPVNFEKLLRTPFITEHLYIELNGNLSGHTLFCFACFGRLQMFSRIGVFKTFVKFIRKYLYRNLFLIKLQADGQWPYEAPLGDCFFCFCALLESFSGIANSKTVSCVTDSWDFLHRRDRLSLLIKW